MENANDHPFKVSIVKDAKFFANSHPYKVTIEGGGGNEGRVVDELPEEGEPGYIYLVLKESSPEGNIYDEYMWVLQQDGETYGWEHIGATNEVNLDVVKTLTADDYNWNRGTQSATEPYDSVAIWLLDDGLYTGSPDTTICPVRNWSMGNYSGIMMNRKSSGGPLGYGVIVSFAAGGAYMWSGVNGGVAAFEQRLDNPPIEQTTGQNSTRLMSQKAITDAIDANVGKAKVLTADDYDYPSNNPDGVALWNLAPGVYKRETTTKVYITDSHSRAYDIYLVGGKSSTNYITEWAFDDGGVISRTVSDTGIESNARTFLTDASVVDNLTSTLSTKPLSAKQGRILNNKIGQIETVLQTLTTGNGV